MLYGLQISTLNCIWKQIISRDGHKMLHALSSKVIYVAAQLLHVPFPFHLASSLSDLPECAAPSLPVAQSFSAYRSPLFSSLPPPATGHSKAALQKSIPHLPI